MEHRNREALDLRAAVAVPVGMARAVGSGRVMRGIPVVVVSLVVVVMQRSLSATNRMPAD
ncbi:hypothetical protein OAJ60_01485 [Planctomycetaceae bacterium]|nr:hypothetical protein [Planctomycetaceae bacterium]